jgi:hypothetical protein
MSPRSADPTLVRQRQLVRAGRLKRRFTSASILGFAAFFALAAQHVVRGASASSTKQADPAAQPAATSHGKTFFDQGGGTFSFGDPVSALPSDFQAAPEPMAQSSVS